MPRRLTATRHPFAPCSQIFFFFLPSLFVATEFRDTESANERGEDEESDDDDDDDEWDDDYFEEIKIKRTKSVAKMTKWFERRVIARLFKCALFFQVPKVKYLLHNCFLLLYIVIVVVWLCRWPMDYAYHSPDFYKGYPHIEPATFQWVEILWWVWTAARGCEEVITQLAVLSKTCMVIRSGEVNAVELSTASPPQSLSLF